MTVIGIDPGVSGAIVALLDQGDLLAWDMPTIEVHERQRISAIHLADLLVDIGPVEMVVVEDVQGVQGSGATSAFAFGRGAGVIEGVLAGLRRPVTYVRPQVWTKDLGVGSDKGAHRQAATRLWPAHSDLFRRVKDDGRADAALVAWWFVRSNR
jgi:crossover junction endodeoxyribonuclease RuvC